MERSLWYLRLVLIRGTRHHHWSSPGFESPSLSVTSGVQIPVLMLPWILFPGEELN